MRKDTTVIEDAMIVAYLVMKNYLAIPYIKMEATGSQGSRVAWDVQGDPEAIESEIKMFWANEKVGIRDYTRVLKDIRSNMYTMKSMKGQLKGS
jgi:hypothetical protein